MQVFMSHSNKDEEGKSFFNQYFAVAKNTTAFWYTFEGVNPPHSIALRRAISESQSIFVLKSRFFNNYWTYSWINYEVGLAYGMGLPVFVFENPSNFYQMFPIPFVTAYIQRPKKAKDRKKFPFNELIEFQNMTNMEELNNINPEFKRFTCRNDKCKATYFIFLNEKNTKFTCPVCGKKMKDLI